MTASAISKTPLQHKYMLITDEKWHNQ